MPIDSHVLNPGGFDAEAAREASLAAMLARVRLRRRVRRGTGAAAVLLVVTAAVWLTMPGTDRTHGQPVAENPLVIRSAPLTAAETIIVAAEPELFVRTPAEPDAALRATTPPDTAVPRLGEAEFHSWLAAHEVYCLQVGGDLPQVLPLRLQ